VKFLADMGVSPATVLFLRGLGHDAVRLSELGLEKRSDHDVIAYAREHGQVLITFDLDYPALLALNPESRVSAIILRTTIAEPEWINQRLHDTQPVMTDALTEGAIAVVEDDRIRLRRFFDL
jgi:predicted nuclease of predicted toxin-antitoxin system